MTNHHSTRRGIIASMAALPIAVAAGVSGLAIAQRSTFAAAYTRHQDALARFNAVDAAVIGEAQHDAIERDYLDALVALDRTHPESWHEFVQAFEAALGSMYDEDDILMIRLADAKRILAVRS